MSLEFLITCFIIVVSPGAGVLYTLSIGLSRGAHLSVAAAVGCTIGIVPHLAAVILGLAALLHTSALAFQIIKYLGVVYLLYMAWHTWRERGAFKMENAQQPHKSATEIGLSGVLTNTLNPKLSIFFLAFLPQFISPNSAQPLIEMIQLSAVFMAMTLVIFTIYGLCAATVRSHIHSRPQVLNWVRRVFAATFVALGAKLALSGSAN
ncbi:LysE family translocator [Neisseriaceae bacterium TC5R-5]|nr:LysE family translocator [Neisseriaceae bacterium TC5R-5]